MPATWEADVGSVVLGVASGLWDFKQPQRIGGWWKLRAGGNLEG